MFSVLPNDLSQHYLSVSKFCDLQFKTIFLNNSMPACVSVCERERVCTDSYVNVEEYGLIFYTRGNNLLVNA